MTLFTFSLRDGGDVLEFTEILMNDLAFVIRHRVKMSVHMRVPYFLRNSGSNALELAVTVFTIVVDINIDADVLFVLAGAEIGIYRGLDDVGDRSQRLTVAADDDRVVLCIEDDVIGIFRLQDDLDGYGLIKIGEVGTEIIKDKILNILTVVCFDRYGIADTQEVFFLSGHGICQFLNGAVFIFGSCI